MKTGLAMSTFLARIGHVNGYESSKAEVATARVRGETAPPKGS